MWTSSEVSPVLRSPVQHGWANVRAPHPPGARRELTMQRRDTVALLPRRRERSLAGNATESGRSVTSKITSILLTFTEGSEHSLTEIARLAGLPISTAHRLTSELASWRLLERTEDGQYRAGLPLRMIGTVDGVPPSIAERAPCVLEDLSAATKCRARLGVLRDLELNYIQKQPGPQPATGFSVAATL